MYKSESQGNFEFCRKTEYVCVFVYVCVCEYDFSGDPVIKNTRANAEGPGDAGSIPVLGRSPGEGNGNCYSILAWESPWTEAPGWPQFIGLQSQP